MTFSLQQCQEWFDKNEEKIKQDFFSFLRFRSISTDPAYHDECKKTAAWLVQYLEQEVGIPAKVLTSPSLPVVFAHLPKPGACSVFVYHHYDVQPVDPLELWKNDPFDPSMEKGCVFARGASDNKGQCFITLTAIKAMRELFPNLPLELKLFIEGEEESGGAGTYVILEKYKDLFLADALCVIDFDAKSLGAPCITMGYRGLVAAEITCTNAEKDLHSGVHGGIARNALQILTQALAKCFLETGEAKVDGLQEGIEALSEEEKKEIDFSFDAATYQREFPVGALHLCPGRSLKENNTIYPTLEINGLWGGYTGVGFKTVIPAMAQAKISCRIVAGQDPHKIQNAIENSLRRHIPEGCKIDIRWLQGAKGFRSAWGSPLINKVAKSLEGGFQKSPSYVLCGASVPIVHDLAEVVGGEVALFGFALATDNIHAPNEHFCWEHFKKGFLSMMQLFWELSS